MVWIVLPRPISSANITLYKEKLNIYKLNKYNNPYINAYIHTLMKRNFHTCFPCTKNESSNWVHPFDNLSVLDLFPCPYSLVVTSTDGTWVWFSRLYNVYLVSSWILLSHEILLFCLAIFSLLKLRLPMWPRRTINFPTYRSNRDVPNLVLHNQLQTWYIITAIIQF